jgi:hypothetical protein
VVAGRRVEAPQGSPSHDLDRAGEANCTPAPPDVCMTLNYSEPLVITQRKRDEEKTQKTDEPTIDDRRETPGPGDDIGIR